MQTNKLPLLVRDGPQAPTVSSGAGTPTPRSACIFTYSSGLSAQLGEGLFFSKTQNIFKCNSSAPLIFLVCFSGRNFCQILLSILNDFFKHLKFRKCLTWQTWKVEELNLENKRLSVSGSAWDVRIKRPNCSIILNYSDSSYEEEK